MILWRTIILTFFMITIFLPSLKFADNGFGATVVNFPFFFLNLSVRRFDMSSFCKLKILNIC